MTQDEIIEMARQAGFEIGEIEHSESIFNPYTDDEWRINKELEAFAKLVAEAERKECAKVAEEWVRAYPHPSEIIANKIKERGQQ